MKNKWVFVKRVLSLTGVFLLLSVAVAFAQEEQPMTKKQKKAHEKKEQQKQDARKAEIEGRKRHMKLQDKETRKRMKKNRKKGSNYVSRKPRWIDRLLAPFKK
jgi:Ni/Co efflux regulator RcnB